MGERVEGIFADFGWDRDGPIAGPERKMVMAQIFESTALPGLIAQMD